MARIGATNNINTGLRSGLTGDEYTVGIEGKGGNLTEDAKSGAKKFFAVGDYARILGAKSGTPVDLSSYSPEMVKAVQKEAWRKNYKASAENKKKLTKTAAIVAAPAIIAAIVASGGTAAAPIASAGSAGTAAGGAAGAGLGAGAATGAAGGIGAGISAGMAQGAAAGMGAAGAGAAGAAGATAASGAGLAAGAGGIGMSTYLKGANAALQAANSYSSAKEQAKVAKEAGKPKDTKRSPYYNEAISNLVRYLLDEQARVYQRRMQGYGAQPGDYTPFAQLLQQIPSSYRG